MTPTEAMTETSIDRERALAPYLERLRCCGDLPADATSIDLGDRALPLAPWERELLRKFGDGVDETGHSWPTLAREGLAFVAKAGTPPEEIENGAVADELILEAAAGAAILIDLQLTLEQLIRDGRMKQVKLLSDLRNRINQSVTAMKGRVDATSQQSIESRAAAMVTVRPQAEPPAAPAQEPRLDLERRVPTRLKKDAAPARVIHGAAAESGTPFKALLVVLILSAAVWVGLTLTRPSYVGPPVLSADAFGQVAIVESIEARPPSLFIKLDGASWGSLGAAQRLDAIRQAASIAERAGYVGAQFWTPDGAIAGRWSKKQGAELVVEAPEGS